jgi:ParB family transcriptional regulator, chromosome partitioning protein
MSEDQPRSRLGRGLAALIGDAGDETSVVKNIRVGGQRRIPLEFLRPNPFNPRKTFRESELAELAASVKEKGIIQPIVARTVLGSVDAYEIIAGERRWRAAQRVGLADVPVILIEAGDREALELAIIENVQRADLNPLEEAMGYEQLMAQFDYGQQELSQVVGKSRSHVANTLRLLKLPRAVQDHVNEGTLSAGHARALLSVRDPDVVARRVIDQGLTVRDVERIAQRESQPAPETARAPKVKGKDADTMAVEKALSDALGLNVSIDHGSAGGVLSIRYKTLEQLEALCRKLQQGGAGHPGNN